LKTPFWRGLCPALLMLIVCYSVSYADEGKISGLFFGDYYYVLKNHNEALEKRNGFQFRRIYLNYDKGLSEEFALRLRFEMNSPSFPKDGVILTPFVKHGYLQWTKSDWRTTTYFGLSGTPTWGVIEDFWGYRPVAKTLLDLQRIGSSTDFGVAVKGSIDATKKLSYHAMVGNGSGINGETDKEKRGYLSLTARPVKGLVVEGYGEYDPRGKDNNRYTVQGFLGYEQEKFRVGAQFASQTRQTGKGKDNLNISGFSVFGTTQVVENRLWALARFDKMFEPNPDGERIAYTPYANTAGSNTIILGLDWIVAKDVHIMPNLFLVFYDEPARDKKPDADIMPRFTVYYRY
jgi:hypothetical protein